MATPRVHHTRKPGRPVAPTEVPSDAQKDIFLKTYAEDLSEYNARKASGLSRAQVAELKAKDPTFVDAMMDCLEGCMEKVQAAAIRQAIQGDRDLAKLLLQSRMPQIYSPKTKVEISIGDVTKLSDEEIEARIREIERNRVK